MAGGSLLALIDDIASILDDVAAMSKVAAKKTASVLGDDLALNAQQVTGVKADRELPIVWAVAKGSMINKAILVPLALLISAFIPWAITPLLMIGGAYLCYEGFEKIAHKLMPGGHHEEEKPAAAEIKNETEAKTHEKDKVKGAVRTDFILSAEIIVISLGIVSSAPFLNQVTVMVLIAVAMTIGVYGLVGAIVKIDDAGLYLSKLAGESSIMKGVRAFGRGIVNLAPWLMKMLSVVGTIAMFLVGGGIVVHGIAPLHHLIEEVSSGFSGWIAMLLSNGANLVLGFIIGSIVLLVVNLIARVRGKSV